MEYLTEKLAKSLENESEAFLIESDINRFYLTGFKSSAGAVLVTKGASYLLVDFRYGEAAEKAVKSSNVIVYDKLIATLNQLIEKHQIKKLYLEAASTTIERLNFLNQNLKSNSLELGTDETLDRIINNMRLVKSKSEVNNIIKAQKITEDAFMEVLSFIKPGVTEREIALFLEFSMRKKGAEAVSFDLITITGSNTSLPHGVPGDKTVKSGDFVTMDIGALYNGYHSDMTRTVAVGTVTEEQKNIYSLVLKAQQNALQAVKAGVTAESVDNAARSVIEKSGYGSCFRHSTGHGVGLQIHELPFVTLNNKALLSSGMVITIEPGIYIPSKFGVRIEDMVCVTKNGCNNLTTAPKELIII